MNDFIFENKTTLIFGKDAESKVGATTQEFGVKKALVCYGQGSAKKSGLLDRVFKSLSDSKVTFCEYGGISANPHKTHTLDGIKFAIKNKCDFILAVGGGSVIDAAKCIAIGAVDSDVWEYYLGNKEDIKNALPIGTILTLPAAGSEGSAASVIRDEKTGLKYAVGSDVLRPKFSFINPALMFTLPSEQIAFGASDILAHLLERYFSPQDNVVLTDNLLTGAIKSLFTAATNVYNDNTNYDYWAEFCLLGTLAHNDFLSLGRNCQDWATHNIENTFLSGIHNIAHGAGLAIIFLAWLKLVSQLRPKKILQFCNEVMGASGKTDDEITLNGINKLEQFYKSINLPIRLSDVNVSADQIISQVAAVYKGTTSLGGYGKLTVDEIKRIIELAK